MKSQQQGAAQSLECLAMRTKVDWHLPNTARAIPDTINKMASTYIRQKKRSPFISGTDHRTTLANESKVIKKVSKKCVTFR